MSDLLYDEDGPYLPGHQYVYTDLGTPRQYTARGGWNISCECGETYAESGDSDYDERWIAHLTEILEKADTKSTNQSL